MTEEEPLPKPILEPVAWDDGSNPLSSMPEIIAPEEPRRALIRGDAVSSPGPQLGAPFEWFYDHQEGDYGILHRRNPDNPNELQTQKIPMNDLSPAMPPGDEPKETATMPTTLEEADKTSPAPEAVVFGSDGNREAGWIEDGETPSGQVVLRRVSDGVSQTRMIDRKRYEEWRTQAFEQNAQQNEAINRGNLIALKDKVEEQIRIAAQMLEGLEQTRDNVNNLLAASETRIQSGDSVNITQTPGPQGSALEKAFAEAYANSQRPALERAFDGTLNISSPPPSALDQAFRDYKPPGPPVSELDKAFKEYGDSSSEKFQAGQEVQAFALQTLKMETWQVVKTFERDGKKYVELARGSGKKAATKHIEEAALEASMAQDDFAKESRRLLPHEVAQPKERFKRLLKAARNSYTINPGDSKRQKIIKSSLIGAFIVSGVWAPLTAPAIIYGSIEGANYYINKKRKERRSG